MRRKELFYCVISGSNVTRDVHWCVTVDYQQIANDNIANQIHGFSGRQNFPRLLNPDWSITISGARRMQGKPRRKKNTKKLYKKKRKKKKNRKKYLDDLDRKNSHSSAIST